MGSSTVHWYLYFSTIHVSTALPSTCKVFKYLLLKVTCACTESLSQVLKLLNWYLKYMYMYTREQMEFSGIQQFPTSSVHVHVTAQKSFFELHV